MYLTYESKYKDVKAWELDKMPDDPDDDMDINYKSIYKYYFNYLNTKKGAKKEEIEALARYVACFTYQNGIDRSREAFNNCHDYDVSAKAYFEVWDAFQKADDDDGEDDDDSDEEDSDDEDKDSNAKDSGSDESDDDDKTYVYNYDAYGDLYEDNRDAFVEDIIEFWDTYLDYKDEELS